MACMFEVEKRFLRIRIAPSLLITLLLWFGLAGAAQAAELTFNRIYQGSLSGQTFTTTSQLTADAGSVRFSDGGTQRAFQNTSGTLTYTVGGVQHSETGVLNSRYPNGNTLMNAVAFSGTGGDRLLVLGGAYTAPGSYSGSSNAIVAKLNEYIDATAPDPAQTTLLVNGGSSASVAVGQSATIVVTVKLGSGSGVSGATVSLSASPSGASSISPSTATTDSGGQATFTVQGLSSGSVTYNAVASANGTTTTSAGSVVVTFVGVRSAAQSSAVVPGGTVGSATTVTVSVRDGSGTPVAGAASALSVAIGGTNASISPSAIIDTGGGAYTFSYVPTAAGTDSIAIRLDGTAISGSPYSSIVTAPTLIFTPGPGALPAGSVGTAYSQTVSVSGGTAPYSFSASGVPAGLTINTSTGAITGTPTTAGSYSVTVNTLDAHNVPGSVAYAIAVAAQGSIANAVSATVAANSANTPIALAITGGTATSVAAASQPAHGTASASGTTITYTPVAGYSGSDSFTYTATNASGTSAPGTVSVTVSAPPLVFTPAPGGLPAGTAGNAYNQTIAVSGGTVPYSFTANGLPAGLTINPSTGAISGTPTNGGTSSTTIHATDAYGVTSQAIYSITVAEQMPVANAVSVTVAANSSGNAVPLSVSGGAAASVGVASQAAHGTAAASGTTISYTPAAGYSGSDSFTYTAVNGSGTSAPAMVTVTIAPATLVLAPSPGGLPGGTVGTLYSQTISASGGTAPYSFGASGVPAGLSLNPATGAVTGTPTVAGSFPLTVTVADAHGANGSAAYTIVIAGLPPIAGATSATVAANSANNGVPLSLTGGSASSVAVTSPPSHGSASASGTTITYTPTAGYSGSDSFAYTATNASGTSAPATVSISVTATPLVFAPTPGALPNGIVGIGYSQALTASGGAAPYGFTATGLPPGLTIQTASGALAGTPTNAGTYSVIVTATDANGAISIATYNVTISPQVPVVNAVALSVAANSTNNAVTLALSGGPASVATVASAPLHGTASAAGTTITYTPAAGYSGTDSFTYTATNASGTSAAATVSVTVAAPAFTFAPAPGALPGGTVGIAYGQTIASFGGTGPYIFAAAALPPGLTINSSTGAISGTPTAEGTYPVTVSVTDAHGATGSAAYSVAIAAGAPVANAVAATVAANSTSNAVAPSLSGGAATGVAIGAPPSHGTASASGSTISYTPAPGYSGSDSFTYTATNAAGTSAAAAVSITVTAPTLAITPAPGPLPGGTATVAYSQVIAVAGGSGHYGFVATGLPAGLSIDPASGAVAGTPTTPGSYSVTISVTDANGATGSATYTLAIAVPPPPTAADSTSTSVPANTTTQAGQNVGINLSSLVSGDYTEIRIITQPKHGRLAISRTVAMRLGGTPSMMMAILTTAGVQIPSQVMAVYTPDANYQGADSFQFAAVGPGGVSAPATVAINVVGRAPTARTQTVSTIDGQPVSVELTAGASDGPFTGATILSVSPSDQATAAIVPAGAEGARTFRLDVTPKAHFGGAIAIAFTLSNAFGTSAPATVTVNVNRRADPTADPIVQAVSDAQAEAARRFARAQTSNFMQRAEGLHDACARSVNGVRLGSSDGSYDPLASRDHQRPASDASDPKRASPERERADKQAGPTIDSDRCNGSVAVWTGGTVEVGTRDAVTRRSKISATTSGVSAGIDVRLAKRLAIGIGGGLGHDSSAIADGKGHVAADSKTIAVYASLVPVPGMFVDGALAHGWLDFATRRSDATTSALASARRSGRFTTGALAAGIERVTGGLHWSLYGRADYLTGTLDAYREQGAGLYDLRFDKRRLRSATGALGFRAAYRRPLSFGLMAATLRGEWQHEFTNGGRQGLDYADVTGPSFYGFATQGWSREQFMVSPGVVLTLPSDWEFGLSMGIRAASGERAASTNVQVRKQF